MTVASLRSVPFLAAFLLLSGCTSASPTADDDGRGASIVAGDVDVADAATLQGLVLDDNDLPLVGATVGINDLGLSATTDEGGSYLFTNLAPGAYVVSAIRLGYESDSRRVELVAGEETRVVFRLVAIVIEEAYHELHGPYAGFFTCKVGTPTQSSACGSVLLPSPLPSVRTDDILWANDKAFQWFNMSAENWRSFVGELEWTQGTFATSTKLRTSFSHERFGSHWWCAAEGRSPLEFRFEQAEVEDEASCNTNNQGGSRNPTEPDPKKPIVIGFRVPFGSVSASNPEPVHLAFQQKVTSYMTVFYGELPPDTYHARPDA